MLLGHILFPSKTEDVLQTALPRDFPAVGHPVFIPKKHTKVHQALPRQMLSYPFLSKPGESGRPPSFTTLSLEPCLPACSSCGVKGGISPNYLLKKNNVTEENPSTEHSTFTCSLCCACPGSSSWGFGCKRASWPVSSVGITRQLKKQSSAQISLFYEFRLQT